MFAIHEDAEPVVNADGIETRTLCHGGSMLLIEYTFPRGARSKAHRHVHEQMGFVRSGRFEVCVGRHNRVLGPADGYYVPPGERHCAVALEDRSVLVDCFTPSDDRAGTPQGK